MEHYDDIIAVCSDHTHLIETGSTELVRLSTSVSFYFPYCGNDGRVDIGGSYQTDDNCTPFLGGANNYEYVNNRLISLGYGDKIFRDGITVGELEKYFDLVTDSKTFAPLFED